jgi:hypothetical protein
MKEQKPQSEEEKRGREVKKKILIPALDKAAKKM